jgi:glycosyl transferase, family 25
MSAGEIGCYLSHMNIYQEIVEKNISKAIIFEDDIKIIDDNFQKIVNIISQKEYFDICLLGYHYKKRDNIENMFYEYLDETHNMLKISKREWGGYGYIITNKACQKLLKYKNNIFLPVDTLGRDKHFDKFLDVYCVHPSLIEVDTKNSGLEKERMECKKASSKNIFKHFFSYFG